MKLTNEQLEMLKTLSTEKGILGKRLLKDFIWLNTEEPLYKEGDYVIFSDLSTSVYGIQVKDFRGQITNINRVATSKTFIYTITCILYIEYNTCTKQETITLSATNDTINCKTVNNINCITKGE